MALHDMAERVIANQRRQILIGAVVTTVVAIYLNLGLLIDGQISIIGMIAAGICATAWFAVVQQKIAADKRAANFPKASIVK
jgi:hypothetical protein